MNQLTNVKSLKNPRSPGCVRLAQLVYGAHEGSEIERAEGVVVHPQPGVLEQLVRLRPVLGLLVQAARDKVRERGREGFRGERGCGVVDDLREEDKGVGVG